MKALMLVSQSNTGSSWFAGAMRLSCPELRGPVKEHFNPVLNHEHQRELSGVFGSESYPTVPNLAKRHERGVIDLVLRKTWDSTDLNFTKENYLAYQIDTEPFRDRFNMVGLLGKAVDCFPPVRIRVMTWYENWFYSLLINARFDEEMMAWVIDNATTAERRAVIGWTVVRWRLSYVFTQMSVPVVRYETLVHEDEVGLVAEFERLKLPAPLEPQRLARAVVDTRIPQERSVEHAKQWADALSFRDEFCGRAWPQDLLVVRNYSKP